MSEEHLHLLSLVSGYLVGLGLAAFAGKLAGFLMGLPGDVSRLRLRAANFLGRADLAGGLQGTVFLPSAGILAPVRIGVVPTELLQNLSQIGKLSKMDLRLCIPMDIRS